MSEFTTCCCWAFLLAFYFGPRPLDIRAESIPNSRGHTVDSTGENTNCRCAEEETFVGVLRSGAFKSPGFPHNYCDLLNCKWTIQPAQDSFVSAEFDFFETEHKFDALEVYQTRWNGSQLMMAKQSILSGRFDPSSMESHFFSSLGGGLHFRFVTDNKDHDHRGFQMSFQRHDKDMFSAFGGIVYAAAKKQPWLAICGFNICGLDICGFEPFHLASDQAQMLPILASRFRTDSSCIFLINSTQAIKLTISRFADSVLSIKIYETENFQAQIGRADCEYAGRNMELAKIEGFAPPLPLELISRTSSMTIVIKTARNYLVAQHYQFVGIDNAYQIKFKRAKSICECFPAEHVVSRVHPTTLLSPGFPLEYCDQHNCTTRVTLEDPIGQISGANDASVEVLGIGFESFQTYGDPDFITLKQGSQSPALKTSQDNSNRPMIKLSESARNIGKFTFDAPQFELNFVTDNSIVLAGFNITLEAYRKPRECLCPRDSILKGDKHSEQNEFDARKCTFMDCLWAIHPTSINLPTNHRLLIELDHSLGDPDEWIRLFNGFTELDTFVGDASNNGQHMVEFNMSPLLRATALHHQVPAMMIWYHREWPDYLPVQRPEMKRIINFSYEWRDVCQCGPRMLTASTQEWLPLRSPDHPHTYCRNMRCQWTLDTPQGNHLLLNITEFDTEADQDFLTIFDGNDTTQKHLEMLAGLKTFRSPLRSAGNQMTLMFVTDSSIQMKGFEIWFKAFPNEKAVDAQLTEKSSGLFSTNFALFFVFIMFGGAVLLVMSRRNAVAASSVNPFPSIQWPSWLRLPGNGSRRAESASSIGLRDVAHHLRQQQ